MNVLFVFGPNLGALGRRDPDTYGRQSLAGDHGRGRREGPGARGDVVPVGP